MIYKFYSYNEKLDKYTDSQLYLSWCPQSKIVFSTAIYCFLTSNCFVSFDIARLRVASSTFSNTYRLYFRDRNRNEQFLIGKLIKLSKYVEPLRAPTPLKNLDPLNITFNLNGY